LPTDPIIQQLNDVAIMKDHTVEMYFNPDSWSHTDFSIRKWEIINFPPNPRNSIPRVSGVYAFVVEPNIFDKSKFFMKKRIKYYNMLIIYTKLIKLQTKLCF